MSSQGSCLSAATWKLNSPSSPSDRPSPRSSSARSAALDALRVLLHLCAGPRGSCDARSSSVEAGVPRPWGQGRSRWRGLCPQCLWSSHLVRAVGMVGGHPWLTALAQTLRQPSDSGVRPDHTATSSHVALGQMTLLSEPQLQVEGDKMYLFKVTLRAREKMSSWHPTGSQ